MKFNGLTKLAMGMTIALTLGTLRSSSAQTLPATITVNAGTTVASFIPVSIFGNNTAYWIGNTSNLAVQPQVQAAGNYFLRYPGGSSSDGYHWNGTGTYNASGYWVPDNTNYTTGFPDNATYEGSTSGNSSPSQSQITDGSTATTWLSNVDTDFSNQQWAELDLSGPALVNAVTIVWGTPYAASFQIQYWPTNGYPPLDDNSSNKWNTISTVAGTGGTQGVVFTGVTAQYFRVLMTASSAGAGGAYAIAEVTLYDGGTQVSVNNPSANVQTQVEVSSMDPASTQSTTNLSWMTDFAAYMTYVNSFSPHAIPLITVNFGTGTAQEAAAWVHYANAVRGYGIHYWQIGNETEGNWETGGPIPTQDYVRRYIEYYNAMKAVDSSIIITGPVAGGFNDSSNMYDGKGVVEDFISILAAKGAIGDLNAIDYHWYPNYGNYTPATALASTSTLDAYPGPLNSWLIGAGAASPSTIPVLMSEYNVDPGDENFQVQLGNGLWVADALGHFITDFGSRGYTNLWDTLNGGTGDTNPGGGDLGYLNVNNDGYQYQPHAAYWAMQMMTNDWAIPGDTNAHQLISTTISGAGAPASLFAAYSDYRPDGVLSMIVINKNPTNAYDTWITGLPFIPNSNTRGWIFNSTNYQWVSSGATPYHASPDTAPTAVTFTGASSSFPVTFQPYSISVLQFVVQLTPTPTATSTPCTDGAGHTCTPTFTPTPTLSPTPTATPENIGVLFPNPVKDGTPLSFYYNLTSPADQVKVKLFTLAFRKIYEDDTLPAGVGTWKYSLGWGNANLANGLYYVALYVKTGGSETHKVMKLLIQR